MAMTDSTPVRVNPAAMINLQTRRLWLFMAIDQHGTERLLSFQSGGRDLPLLTTSGDSVPILAQIARDLAQQLPDQRIELRLFQGEMRVLDVIPAGVMAR